MHINVIHSGNNGRYTKRLLRVSYRVNGRVRKTTLINVTKWNEQALRSLEGALRIKRVSRGTPFEQEANLRIVNIVLAHARCEPWKIGPLITAVVEGRLPACG